MIEIFEPLKRRLGRRATSPPIATQMGPFHRPRLAALDAEEVDEGLRTRRVGPAETSHVWRAGAAGSSARASAGGENEQQQRGEVLGCFHGDILSRHRVYTTSPFMPRAYARTTVQGAVERLRPGLKVLLPPGCGEPVALVGEICRRAERLTGLTLMGGLHLGDFPFARPDAAPLRIATWHMSARLAAAGSRVEFVPIRYFDLVTEFNRG